MLLGGSRDPRRGGLSRPPKNPAQSSERASERRPARVPPPYPPLDSLPAAPLPTTTWVVHPIPGAVLSGGEGRAPSSMPRHRGSCAHHTPSLPLLCADDGSPPLEQSAGASAPASRWQSRTVTVALDACSTWDATKPAASSLAGLARPVRVARRPLPDAPIGCGPLASATTVGCCERAGVLRCVSRCVALPSPARSET